MIIFKGAFAQTCMVPLTQASNLTITQVGSDSAFVSWLDGTGDGRVVYISTSSNFSLPTLGNNPVPNTQYTGGQQCVFNGNSGSNVWITGLSPNVTYYVIVLEYCTPDYDYNNNLSISNNQSFTTLCTAPTLQASGVTITNISSSSATVNWTNGNGQGRVVYISTINSFVPPAPSSNPSASTQYLGGQQCIYNGTGSGPIVVTGLISNTTYYVRVYEYCLPSRNYLLSGGINNPGSFTTPRFVVRAGDCATAVNVCTDLGFTINPSGFGAIDELSPFFNTISNPLTNPNPPNMGCLRNGEVNSTWLLINVFSTGLLEFTLGAVGDSSLGRCYDWILWRYDSTACTRIRNNQLAPVRCNWNGNPCRSFTGMANTLPGGGRSANFQSALSVNCGEQYILCFSNFTGDTTTVPLNFFGSAVIGCGTNVPLALRASTDTLCFGQNLTLTATGSINNQYNWSFSPPPNTAWAPLAGNQSVRTESPPTPNPLFTYRYAVWGNTMHCGVAYDTVDVLVVPEIRNNMIGNAQTICANTAPIQLTGAVPTQLQGGNSTYQYQWQSSRNNSTWTNLISATLPNYTPPMLDSTTYYRRIVVSGPCTDISPSIEIRVFPVIAPAQILSSQTICFGQQPTALTGGQPSGGTGLYTYQWQSSSFSNSSFSNITGAINPIYQPPILFSNTYYRLRISSGPCQSFSNPISINVLPQIIGDTIFSSQTICQNSAPGLFTGTLPSGGNSSFTYLWQSAPDSSGIWNNIPGATGQNYQQGILTDTAFFRRIILSGPCIDTSQWLRVIVHSNINPNLIGNNQTICRNSAFQQLTGTLPFGGSGSYIYTWESSGNNSTWSPVVGGTGRNLNGFNLVDSVWFRRIVFSPPCPADTSPVVRILIDSLVTNNQISAAQTICFGLTPAVFSGNFPSGGNSNYQYQWQSSSDHSVWTDIPGATLNSYGSGALNASTYFRRVIVAGACPGNTGNSVFILVNPPVGNNTISNNQSLCTGVLPSVLSGSIPSGGTSSYTYEWFSSLDQVNWNLMPGETSLNYSPGPLSVTTYFRRIVYSTPCSLSVSNTLVIQFQARPGNNFIGSTQTICANQSTATLTGTSPTGGNLTYQYQWLSSPNDTIWQWVGGATSQSLQPILLTQSTYFRRIVLSGACPPDTSVSIPVLVLPLITNNSIASNQTICNGFTPATLTGSVPSGGIGQFVFQWQSSLNSSLWSDITGAVQADYSPGSLSVSTYFRRVVQSSFCQDITPFILIIVQNPITGNTITSPQTICTGNIPVSLTGSVLSGGNGTYQFQWQSSSGQGIWNTIIGAVASGYSPPALSQSTYFRRVVTSLPCPVVSSDSLLIIVEQSLTNNSIQNNQTICIGQTPAPLSGALPSGGSGLYSYIWQTSTNNSTWSGVIPVSNTQSFTPGPLTSQLYFRRVVTGGVCPATTSASIGVLVLPLIGSNTIGNNQTICQGSVPLTLTGILPTGGSGQFVYAWESSTNQSTWAVIAGALSLNYQPNALTVSTYFRRVVVSNPCANLISNSILVQIQPPPISNAIGSTQTICAGQIPTVFSGSLPQGGNGVFTYQWLSSPDRVVWTNISNTSSFQAGSLFSLTYFRRVVQSGVCPPDSSIILTVDVTPGLSGNAIVADQTICAGSIPNLLSGGQVSGGTGVYTYQWESSPQGSVWLAISGETNAQFNPGALFSTTYFRRVVTSSFCSNISGVVRIVVVPVIGNNQILPSQSICSGQAPVLTGSVPTGGSNVFSYQWESSTDGSNWNLIPGATTANYTSPGMTQPLFFRRIVSSAPCHSDTSNVSQILILPLIGNNLIGVNQTICLGITPMTLTGVIPSGGNMSYVYTWQSALAPSGSWTSIIGGGNQDYLPPAIQVNTYYRRVVQSLACTDTSTLLSVHVQTPLSGNAPASHQTICAGSTPALLSGGSINGGNGQYQFQWESSSDTLSWAVLSGETNAQFQPPALFLNTYYRRQVSSPPCAPNTSSTITITVNPLIGSNQISANQTLCLGQMMSTLTGSLPSGGNGLYGYQWQSSVNLITWTNHIGGTLSNFSPVSLIQTTYFRRIVSAGVCLNDTSNLIQVLVLPAIGQNTIAANQTICSGSVPALITGSIPSGGDGSYAYQWLSSANSQIWTSIPAETQVDYQSLALASTTYLRRFVVSNACTDTSQLIRIWVEFPLGNNFISTDQTLCSGQVFQFLSGTLPTGGNLIYNFQWESSADSITWTTISGQTLSGLSATSLSSSVYFRRVVSSGVCNSITSSPIFIRVWPLISNNTAGSDQTICSGATPILLSGSTPSGGSGLYMYQWLSSRQPMGPWVTLPGNQSLNFQPPVLTDSAYFRRLVQSNLVCSDSGNVVAVAVNPSIGSNTILSSQTICQGVTPSQLSGSLPTGGNGQYTYQWESGLNPNNFSTISGAQSQNYASPPLFTTHYFRRIVQSGVCGTITSNLVMIRVDSIIGNNQIGNSQTICSGQIPALFTGSQPSGGNSNYIYVWQQSTNGLVWNPISGATLSNYQAGPLTTNSYFRRIVQGGICTPNISDSVYVWIDGGIQNNLIQASQTICLGDSSAVLSGFLPSGGNGIYTYSWQSSADTLTWVTVPGETAQSLGAQLPTDTTYYRRVVVSRFCQTNSNVAVIITHQFLGQNTIVANQTLCFGQTPSLFIGSVPSGGSGIYAYAWESSLNQVNWSAIPGSSQMSWQAGSLTDSVWYRRIVSGGPCRLDTSAVLSVIVYPPIGGSIISAPQTICTGTSFLTLTGSMPTGGSGFYTYQWLTSGSGLPGSWQPLPGASADTTPGYLLSQNLWIRRLTGSGGVCVDSGNVIAITVHPLISNNSVLSDQTICLGGTPAFLSGSLPSGGSGMYSYQWQSSFDLLTWQSLSGQTTQSLLPASPTQSVYYRRVVSASPCSASTSLPVSIRVDLPIGANTILGTQTICEGSIPAVVTGSAPTGGNGSYQYLWLSSSNQSSWQAFVPAQTSSNLQTTALSQTLFVRRIVLAGVCTPDTSSALPLHVQQLIGNNTVQSSQTLCQGGIPTLFSGSTPTGGSGTFQYSWQSSAFPINWVNIPGQIQRDYQAPMPSGLSYYQRVVSGGVCSPSTSMMVSIDYVTQIGDNLIQANQTICYGQQPGLISGSLPSGGTGGATYEWQMSIDNINWVQWSGGTSQSLQTGPMVFPLFFRRVVRSGTCTPSTSNMVYIHVFAPLGNNTIGPAQTLCLGGVPSQITGTLPTGGTNSYTYLWESSPDGNTWALITGQTSISYSPGALTQTLYLRRQIISGLCQGFGNGNVIQLTVLPVQSIGNNIIQPSQSLCLGQVAQPFIGSLPTGGTGNYSYEWISSSDLINWQFNLGTNRDFIPPVLSASAYFRRIVRAGTCQPDTSSVLSVIVFPPLGNNQINANHTICSGQTSQMMTGTTPSGGTGLYSYQWLISNDSLQWTVISGATSAQFQSGLLTQTSYFRRIVNSLPCVDSSQSVRVWVLPAIGNNVISAPQTICAGTLPNLLTGSSPNGGNGLYSFAWASSPDGVNWNSIPGETQPDYSPAVLQQSHYFRRTVGSGPCLSPSSPVLITVHPIIGSNLISSDQTLCFGQVASPLTGSMPSGGNGQYLYLWESSSDNSLWSLVTGGTGSGYAPGALIQTGYYRRIVSSSPCAAHTSLSLQLLVLPTIGNNQVGSDQTICTGSAPQLLTGSLPTGGNGIYVYQWLSSNSVSGPWLPIPGETQAGFQSQVLSQTSYFRRLIASGPCSDTSMVISIRVNPLLGNNVISSTQTICQGNIPNPFTGILPSGGNGVYTFSWESSLDSLIWNTIPGGTLVGFSEGVLLRTTYYRRLISAGPCPANTSLAIQVRVDSFIGNNTLASDQTICSGFASPMISGSLPTGGNGSYTYAWQSSINQNQWAVIPGETNQSYNPGQLFQSVYYRRIVQAGVCTTATSNAVFVLVEPPIGGNVISPSQTICSGSTPSLLFGSLPTGGNGVFLYQWQSSSNSVQWVDMSGEINQDFIPGSMTFTTYFRRFVDSGSCSDTSNVLTVIVHDFIGNNTIASNQTLCQNQSVNLLTGSLPSGGSGLYLYQWESSSDAINWAVLPGATSSAYSYGSIQSSLYFRRVVSAPPCPAITSNAVFVLVYPSLTNNLISSDQTICAGTSPSGLRSPIPQGGTGMYLYQWQSASTPSGLWSNLLGSTTRNYTPGNLTATTYFRRELISAPCSTFSNLVEITVDSVIGNNWLAANQTICENSTFMTLTGSLPSGGNYQYQYTWQSSSDSIAWTPAGITIPDMPGQLLSASVYFRRVVAAGICNPHTSNDIRIVVEPTPGNNLVGNSQTICQGTAPLLLTGSIPTGGTGLYLYNWESAALTSPLNWQSISGETNQNYQAPGLMNTTYYRRVSSSGVCPSWYSNELMVTVDSLIGRNVIGNNQTICAATQPASITGSIPSGGNSQYVYQWQSASDNATWSFLSGQTNAFFDPPVILQNTYYRRVVSAGICDADSAISITIEVIDSVSSNIIGNNQTLCSGQALMPLTGSLPQGGGGVYLYQWQTSIDQLNWQIVAGATNQNFAWSGLMGIVWVRRQVLAGICPPHWSNAIRLQTLPPLGNTTLSGSQTICAGQSPGGISAGIPTGGTGAYTFRWESSGNATNWLLIPGVTTAAWTPPALQTSVYFRRIVQSGPCMDYAGMVFVQVNPIPVLSAANATICVGQSITLTASASVPGGIFTWNIPPFNSASVTVAPLSTTTYSVDYVAGGCFANSLNPVVVVNPLPLPRISASDSVVFCFGTSLTLTANPLGLSYAWSQIPGIQFSTAPSVNIAASGTFGLRVTDGNGCQASDTIVLTQRPQLSVAVSGTVSTCLGGNDGTASVTVSGGSPPYAYLWSNGMTMPNLTGLNAGTYSVTVTDAIGCLQTAALNLTDPGGININVTGIQAVKCFGDNDGAASISVSGGNPPYQFAWTTTPPQTTPTATGLFAGSYTVLVTDSKGCFSTQSVVIPQPNAPLSIQVISPPGRCPGSADIIQAIASGGTPPYAYMWSPSAGLGQPNAAVTSVVYSLNTSYTVRVTDANACRILGSAFVQVFEPADARFNILFSEQDSVLMANEPLALTNLSSPANANWNWSFGDGNGSNEFEPNYTYQTEGTYLVSLVVVTPKGCIDSMQAKIDYRKFTKLYVPTAFSPNGDGFNDFFHIAFLNLRQFNVMIFDRWGNKIYQSENPRFRWDGSLNGQALQEGVYTVAIDGIGEEGEKISYAGTVTLIR